MNTLLHISQAFGLVAIVALIWLIVRAFKKHLLWGFAVLLLSPFSALFFGVKHWKDEKKPFLSYITSFGIATSLALYVFTAWGGWEVARAAFKVHQGIQTEKLSQQDAFNFMRANLQFIENSSPERQDKRKVEMMREFLDQHESGMSDSERQKLHTEVVAMLDDETLGAAQRLQLENMRAQLSPKQADITPLETAAATATAPENTRRTLSRRPSTLKAHYRADYREIEISDASKYVGKSFKVTRKNSEERECRLIAAKPGRLQFEQRGRGGTFTFEYRHSDIEKLKLLASVDYPSS